jgi:hypothetical protein
VIHACPFIVISTKPQVSEGCVRLSFGVSGASVVPHCVGLSPWIRACTACARLVRRSRLSSKWAVQPVTELSSSWAPLAPCFRVRGGHASKCPAANGARPVNLPHSPEDTICDPCGLHRTPPRCMDDGSLFWKPGSCQAHA